MNKNSGMLLKDGEDRLYIVRHAQIKGIIIANRVTSGFAPMLDDLGKPKTKVFKSSEAYQEWLKGVSLVGYVD